MLGIYTRKNYLDSEANNYVFRSRTSQTINYEMLIQKMTEYNSTITEADIRSVTSVLSTMILRYAAQGFVVQTPFGSFYACACGTGKTATETFDPQNTKNDHDLYLNYRSGSAEKEKLIANAEYERVSSAFVLTPEISAVAEINKNGSEIQTRMFSSGAKIRLHGDYLKIDATDTEQGIFLQSKLGTFRIEDYNRNGSNILDGIIPADIAKGTYQVIITTKPGKERYESARAPEMVTLTE